MSVIILNRFVWFDLDTGYKAWVLGLVETSLKINPSRWLVTYLRIPAAIPVVRKYEDQLQERFGINYIGSGQQHWLTAALEEMVEPAADGKICWVGWDWISEGEAETDRVRRDAHAFTKRTQPLMQKTYDFIYTEVL